MRSRANIPKVLMKNRADIPKALMRSREYIKKLKHTAKEFIVTLRARMLIPRALIVQLLARSRATCEKRSPRKLAVNTPKNQRRSVKPKANRAKKKSTSLKTSQVMKMKTGNRSIRVNLKSPRAKEVERVAAQGPAGHNKKVGNAVDLEEKAKKRKAVKLLRGQEVKGVVVIEAKVVVKAAVKDVVAIEVKGVAKVVAVIEESTALVEVAQSLVMRKGMSI